MKKKTKSEIREWVESIIIALVLAFIIRTFFVQAFKIPTGSMRPTLIEGDRILVNKIVYKFRQPKIGEIIVFKYPGNPKRDFIKRLVAEGGDVVEIKSGNIFVNHRVLDEPAIFKKIYYYNKGVYGKVGIAIHVPKNALFVLGDNSAASKDSRFWGFVPKKNVIGKAFFIYWPLTRIRVLK